MGIDGWKCDGSDPLVFELPIGWGYQGIVTEREYADMYYRDFYYYTRTKNPGKSRVVSQTSPYLYFQQL